MFARQPSAEAKSSKPFAVSDRLMISSVHFPILASASRSLSPALAAICEHVPQSWEVVDDLRRHQRRAVGILNIGGVNHGVDEIAAGVGQDMALPAIDLLARIPRVWFRQPKDRLHPECRRFPWF